MSSPAAPAAPTPPADAPPGATPHTCPQCAAPLDADPRFAVWCPRCEWNLVPEHDAATDPTTPAAPATPRERAVAARTEQLYQDLAAGRTASAGRRDWLAAAAVASLVHLVTTALFGWALWLLVTGSTPLRCLGAAALAVVVLLRPRIGRVPRGESVLTRSQAPALYGLADRVAAELGAGPVGVIRVDRSFNAGLAVVGLRRHSVLTLGLPLWEALDEQQRIALLGHELAHQVNGDHRRGLWLNAAIGALAHWYDLARPRRHAHWAGFRLLFHVAGLISNAVLHSLAWLLMRTLFLLDRLTARAGHQAEYHADTLAAQAASTEAARGMLEALLLDGAAGTLVSRVRAGHQSRPRTTRRGAADAQPASQASKAPQASPADTLWDRLRDHLAGVPPLERERLLRRSARDRAAVDSTHPPTHLRLALLAQRPPLPAAVTTSPAESAAIATELAPHRLRIARSLLAP
ncbi:M48 family metallopeptidase [Kitasatospora sp. NBC_00085]|uniref:M48 family metalloprotease n=1 Tax=unclassified Kitasatospora TaxID=2633591 RepID=UPI00324ABA88